MEEKERDEKEEEVEEKEDIEKEENKEEDEDEKEVGRRTRRRRMCSNISLPVSLRPCDLLLHPQPNSGSWP